MGAGYALRTQLYAADDTYLQPFDVEHLVGHKSDASRVFRECIGTDVPEIRQANQAFQGMRVELMVA